MDKIPYQYFFPPLSVLRKVNVECDLLLTCGSALLTSAVGLSHVWCLYCCSINVVKAVNLHQSHHNNTCRETMCNIHSLALNVLWWHHSTGVWKKVPTFSFYGFNNQSVNQRYTHRHSLQFYTDLYLITVRIDRNNVKLMKNALSDPQYGNA